MNAIKARDFANDLVACPEIDWISITDNAGGNPQLAPLVLGRPILYAGKEVVIHLTCKDLNRNGLESEAWMLNSEGFNNILAMTGDYPVAGNDGLARPVFDIDSIGLISMLRKMNQGLRGAVTNGKRQQLEKTQFSIGAVTTNFKLREGEVIPQYQKLRKKVASGAQFIINQIGFDSRKISELRCFMDAHGMKATPLIGNVYRAEPARGRSFSRRQDSRRGCERGAVGALPDAGRICRPRQGVFSGVRSEADRDLSRPRISRRLSGRSAQPACD